MKSSTRRVAIIATVLVAAAGGYVMLRPTRVPVETARVTRGPMQVTVDEEGETRVRDRYVVAAPIAGRVARIALRAGDSVTPGRTVARLSPAPLDARAREAAVARVAETEDAQRAAAAAEAQARTALDQARRSRGRAQALAAQGLLAPAERELAEVEESARARELESAEFRARAAAHDVEVARAAALGGGAGSITLRAPVCGQVLRVPEPSERVVAAGTPLLELGDCGRLEIVTDLLSSEAVRVKPGSPMLIDGWGGGTLRGRLRVVEPSGFTKVSALGVEEQRVNVIGDFVDPPGALGDRYRVDVRIVVWEAPSVLQVPGSALVRAGEGWAAFAVVEGRARLRPVTVGHRTPFVAEVLQGLAANDLVIRYPGDRIADGVRIRATR